MGEGLDEPDTVVADDGEDERGHERIVTSRPRARRCVVAAGFHDPPLGASAHDELHPTWDWDCRLLTRR